MPHAGHLMAVLLLAVPLQYLISEWTTPSAVDRVKQIRQLSRSLTIFSAGVLKWKQWPDFLFNWTQSWLSSAESDLGECPAVEVLKYQEKQGFFGMSTVPRTPRAKHVKFQVGQVIRHKLWNYRGVIIGWDETRKASETWARENHRDKEQWKKVPNYAVLVDIRDRPSSQITYVPEELIEIVSNTKIMHSLVEEYFIGFDGARYLPRPWLKKVYPHG